MSLRKRWGLIFLKILKTHSKMQQATPEQIKEATDRFLGRHVSEDGQTLKVRLEVIDGDGQGRLVSALLEEDMRGGRDYNMNVRYVG